MSLPVIGDESSMLRDAAERGDVNGVRHFLSRPTIDLASRGPFGRTALHCAAHAGHAVVVSILLADPRCDANLRDDDGRTPLWLACLMNHYDAVSAFIARSDKVDLSLGDSRGISPWDAAAGVFRINEPTRNLLLNALRNQELEMSVSGGGAMSSSRSSSLVRTPTLTLTTPSGPVPRSSSSLADPKESFRRAQQEDSFIKACHSGDMPAVETYLTSFPDADINGRGTQLITGFMAACEAGQSAIALRLLKDPRLLPNEVDAVGRSAFYMACERNHWSLVQALLPYQDKINVMLGVGKHGGAVSGASLASTASGSKNSLLRIIGAGGGPAVKLPQDAGDQTIKKMVKEGIKRKTELVQARLAEEARAAYIEEQYRQQQAALLSEIEALEAEEAMRQAEEDRRREQEFASKVRADQERRDREKMERRRQLEEAAERKRREEEAAVFAEMSRQEAERARQEAERRRRAEEASMLAEIERLEAEEAARQLLEAKKREEEFAARVLQDNLRRETERAARRQAMAEAAELQRRQEMAAEEARRKREAEKRDAEFRRQQQESERQAELDRRAADLARQEHELRLKEELFKVQEQLAQARIQRSLSASQESARSAGGGAANLSPKTPASGDSTLKNGSEQVVIAGGLSAPSPVGDSNNNGNSAGSARSGGSGNTANSNNPNLRKASSSGSQIPSSTSPHSPNLSHSKYWIEEKDVEVDRTKSLGKGGFAEVFRGKYLKFNDVAVKIMLDTLSDEQSRRFFEAEMKVWAELPAHDNSRLKEGGASESNLGCGDAHFILSPFKQLCRFSATGCTRLSLSPSSTRAARSNPTWKSTTGTASWRCNCSLMRHSAWSFCTPRT